MKEIFGGGNVMVNEGVSRWGAFRGWVWIREQSALWIAQHNSFEDCLWRRFKSGSDSTDVSVTPTRQHPFFFIKTELYPLKCIACDQELLSVNTFPGRRAESVGRVTRKFAAASGVNCLAGLRKAHYRGHALATRISPLLFPEEKEKAEECYTNNLHRDLKKTKTKVIVGFPLRKSPQTKTKQYNIKHNEM